MFERSRLRRAYRFDANETFPGEYEQDRLGAGFDVPYGDLDAPYGRLGETYGELDEVQGDREESNGDRDASRADSQDGYKAQRGPASQAGTPPHVIDRRSRRSISVRRGAGIAVVALVAMVFSALVVHALRAGLAGREPALPVAGPSRTTPRTAPFAVGHARGGPAPTRRGVERRLAAGVARERPRVAHTGSRRQGSPRVQVASGAGVAVQVAQAAGGGISPGGPSRKPEFGFER